MPAAFSFDAPPEVAADFRLALSRVNEATGGILDAAGCLLQMFTRFAAKHVVPGIKNKTSRDGILRRDGFTCSMPHCRRTTNLEIHHVKYRSHGGRSERWNLILLCHPCHLLEHAGHVRIIREGIHQSRSGLAPALIVRVGRRDVTASEAIYQEGLLISRYETPEARPRRKAA